MSDEDRDDHDRSRRRPRNLVIAGSHPDADLAVRAVSDALRPGTFVVIKPDSAPGPDREQLDDLTEQATRSAYLQLRRVCLVRDVWHDEGDIHAQQSADTAPDLNWNAVLSDDSRHRGRRVHTMLREMADFTDRQRESDNVFVLVARLAVKLFRWGLLSVPRRRLRRLTTVGVGGVRTNLLEDVLQLRGLWRRTRDAARHAGAARRAELARQQDQIDNQVADCYAAALLTDLRSSGMSVLFVGVEAGDAADRLRGILRNRGADVLLDAQQTVEHLHSASERASHGPAWIPPALDRNLRPWAWTALRVVPGEGDQSPRPMPRAGRRVVAWAAGGTVPVVLAGALFIPFGQASFVERWMSGCTGGGVFPAESGECVGISDGSFVFDEAYRSVFDKVRSENDAVVDSGNPYVSIAILVPYTIGVDDANTVDSIVGQLQGAYVAQYRANHRTAGVKPPQIRLLLANVGSEGRQWKPVVAELRTRVYPHVDNLVGVAGLGSSFQATADFINRIGDADLPMVASVATADDLMDASSWAFRVAPTNTDEAEALIRYLRAEGIEDGLLVEDLDEENLYARTLASAFITGFGTENLDRYTYASAETGAVGDFARAVTRFCEERPRVVLFAGRAKRDLHDLLVGLADRKCDDVPVRVVTGDDASHLPDDDQLVWELDGSGVTLEYAALAHPSQWTVDGAPPEHTHEDMDWFEHRMHQEFPGAKLDDGQAIMSYDSVLAMVDAAQRAEQREPRAADVYSELLRTRDCDLVLGLSGPVEFDPDGNPRNKTVPILRTDWSTPPTVAGLTWPNGEISTRSDGCS